MMRIMQELQLLQVQFQSSGSPPDLIGVGGQPPYSISGLLIILNSEDQRI